MRLAFDDEPAVGPEDLRGPADGLPDGSEVGGPGGALQRLAVPLAGLPGRRRDEAPKLGS